MIDSNLIRQKPTLIWLTGLSGAGKSTIANLLETRLRVHGKHTYLLDGDDLRRGLSRDLGFADADRSENTRRAAEVSRLFLDAGLTTIVALISPFQKDRDRAHKLFRHDEFLEVFIDTPLAAAEARDPKGLYEKARRGELRNFTGIDSPFDIPSNPEIHIRTLEMSAQEAVEKIIFELVARGIVTIEK